MNEENKTEIPALVTPPPAADKPGRQPMALWLAVLALLGVAVLGWLAWQGNARVEDTRQELSRRLTPDRRVQLNLPLDKTQILKVSRAP
jgi:hypothetical protein